MIPEGAISQKRKELKLTAEELANELGVNVEKLRKWERGSQPRDPIDYYILKTWLDGGDWKTIPKKQEKPSDLALLIESHARLVVSHEKLSVSHKELVNANLVHAENYKRLIKLLEYQFSSSSQVKSPEETSETNIAVGAASGDLSLDKIASRREAEKLSRKGGGGGKRSK